MSDLIDRQKALDAFGLSEKTRKYGGDHSGYDTRMLYEIQDVLEGLPSAEPERTAKVVVHDGYVHVCDIAYPVTEHLCGACKKKVIVGDAYCSHCGAKLEWGEE